MSETISQVDGRQRRRYSNTGPKSRDGTLKVNVGDKTLVFKTATAVELKNVEDTGKVVLRVWCDDDFEDGAAVLRTFNFDAVDSWYWVE